MHTTKGELIDGTFQVEVHFAPEQHLESPMEHQSEL